MFSVVLLAWFQSFNLMMGVGGDFKGLEIAVRNEEINFADCQLSNVNGCIFDEHKNQTQSCIVMNYLKTLGYELASMGWWTEYLIKSQCLIWIKFFH